MQSVKYHAIRHAKRCSDSMPYFLVTSIVFIIPNFLVCLAIAPILIALCLLPFAVAIGGLMNMLVMLCLEKCNLPTVLKPLSTEGMRCEALICETIALHRWELQFIKEVPNVVFQELSSDFLYPLVTRVSALPTDDLVRIQPTIDRYHEVKAEAKLPYQGVDFKKKRPAMSVGVYR